MSFEEDEKKNQGFTEEVSSSILYIILQNQDNLLQTKIYLAPPFFFATTKLYILFEGGLKHELSVYHPTYWRKLHLKFH